MMSAVDGERIALVLAGGGARGAYEAGALSVLVPELDRRGQRPSLFVGTSVGAMNAAYLAAAHEHSAEEAAAGLLENWRHVGSGHIMRPLHQHLLLAAMRYVGETLSLPGFQFSSLLDPAPLEQRVQEWIDLSSLHHHITQRSVDAMAVVATAVRSGRTVVFVESAVQPVLHRSHILDYVPTTIDHVHLRASAALPVLFPPVRIEFPAEAHGWYVDGGTRLNTPIKPALDLGADRIVVVGTDAIIPSSDEPGRHEGSPPDLADGALHVLEGALVDPLAEDIITLGNINLFYSDPEGAAAAQQYRRARGKPPYRRVPYIFIAPDRRGAIGEHALEVFHSSSRKLNLRSVRQRLFSQFLGGDSPAHGQLLSYLFFDAQYLDELIAMGQHDAQHWLTRPTNNDPWQIGPLPELTG
ncbi:NTE family protein [Saccharopolyspora shandongensis]|uniref:NTE family protein n=1 Tax=Saccharopolyspora shandongensis TaxID=418495 RepID=A0A1H3TF19_9PSEU|nr:patatin-like phospholipase family protein [Saccharopolyspora shandongensis]SDZ48547.1 NTE family protein [Saccharopolyspora shandongensis]